MNNGRRCRGQIKTTYYIDLGELNRRPIFSATDCNTQCSAYIRDFDFSSNIMVLSLFSYIIT